MILRTGICLLLLFDTLCIQAQSGKRPPVLSGDHLFTNSRLEGYLWCQIDSSGTLPAAAFLQAMRAGKQGEICPNEVPNFGDTDDPCWLGFQFQSGFSTPELLVIEFDFIGIDSLTLWVYDGDSLVRPPLPGSWRTPLHDRDIPHRVPAFRVMAQPGHTYAFVLRMQKENGTLVAPLTLFTESEFAAYTTRDNLLHGLAAGCLSLAIVLGISFWLLTGQIQYGYYAWYVFGIAVFLVEEQGYLNFIALEHSELLAGPDAWILWSLVAIIGHTLFVIRFLQLHTLTTRGWAWAGWSVCMVCGILLVFLLVGYRSDALHEAALVINAIYALLLFGYLVAAFRYRRTEALLYMVASTPFFLTVLWVCFSTFDLLPESWILYGLLNYSPVWEVSLLCVGLAFSFSRNQRQRLLALEETTRLRRQTVEAMDAAQEGERQRIAQDLHDDVGNTLAAAKGALNTISRRLIVQTELPEVAQAQALIEKAGSDLRTISHNLMPIEFEKYKLTDVVRQLVERANQTSAIQFGYVQAGHERVLAPERSLVLYRIINELVGNTLKHSDAQTAVVQLMYQPESLIVTVEDDGRGISSPQIPSALPGIGLKNVASRATYIGAKLDITTSLSGTFVILEVTYL